MYVIHNVMVPTYFILNQLNGVVDVQTVKSGVTVDCMDLYLMATNCGPGAIS